jgi:glycosyltransferase involved in cell wall biosynthesis
MRIVILGTASPYRGGLTAFNERLARQFVSEGHEVEILTFTMQYPCFLFPGKTQYSDQPMPQDLRITRVMNSIDPVSWVRAGRMIRRMRADLLVVKFWIPLMAPCLGTIARIARRGGTKVVSVLDNVIPHEPHWWDRLLIRYFVHSVDEFVAMSESVLSDCSRFERQAPKRLCPHPLYDNFGEVVPRDEACRQLGLDPQKRWLLFFGFIRDYKGLDLLMRAFADARLAARDDVRLLVAGEFYNNGGQYMQLERDLGEQGRIEWRTEFIPDDKVRLYFSAADMVVQPYKTATQSGVTQIAYHFVKPMLVTRVGGLAETVPHGRVGYVCDVNERSVADALVDFVEHSGDEEWNERLRQNIETEKKKYAWSRMTRTIINN